jgi:hypothetical protein
MTTNNPTPPANAQDKAMEIAIEAGELHWIDPALAKGFACFLRRHLAPPPAPAMDVSCTCFIGPNAECAIHGIASAPATAPAQSDPLQAACDFLLVAKLLSERVYNVAPATAPAGQLPGDDPKNLWCPDRCPITGLGFFMWIKHHKTNQWVPTYGGPYDSYTIPERDDKGEFTRQRYDHDEDGWLIDEYETIPVRVVDENMPHDFEESKRELAELKRTPHPQPTTNADATTAPASQPAASERDAGKVNAELLRVVEQADHLLQEYGHINPWYQGQGYDRTFLSAVSEALVAAEKARASHADAKQDPPPAPRGK